MVQPTPASLDAEPSRPQGVAISALALCALISIYLIQSLLQLVSGTRATVPIFEQLFLFGARVIELLVLWQYWNGREFARVFVLLWSLLVAVRAVAFLADHNLDPTALMSHPLSFLHALLAIFLLYWLNTPPLRAWFKKISATSADLIADRLVGKLCTALDFHSPYWLLTFEHGSALTLFCPFRIVLDDNLAFSYAHAPAAGSVALPILQPLPNTAVPNPSSNPEDARRLLQNLRVTAVRLAPHTSDLFLTFEMGIQLQTWSPAPAVGSPVPAAGSPALPNLQPVTHAPLWSYSDPALTVTATADGINAQLAAPSAEPHAND
jgi:hypothetical protein